MGDQGKMDGPLRKIGDEKISIIVCDHPENQSYPTYWHAGVTDSSLSIPWGQMISTGEREFKLFHSGRKIPTFRYRVIVNSGADLTDAEINAFADEFASKY